MLNGLDVGPMVFCVALPAAIVLSGIALIVKLVQRRRRRAYWY